MTQEKIKLLIEILNEREAKNKKNIKELEETKKDIQEEISNYLYNNGYVFRVETKNGYTSKTRFEICTSNDMKYTFVDLIKRRNGKAYWETYKIS